MRQQGVLTLLGTGGSMGIPVIGCTCDVCRSTLPKNQRLRPGAFLQIGNKQILIDASQDFRTQALSHGIQSLDGVIFTHAHYDHTAGIDDLRIYSKGGKAIPSLMSLETYDELKLRFHYIFHPKDHPETLLPRFDLVILEKDFGIVDFCGYRFSFVSYTQGGMTVNGFKVGDLAFVSDIKEYSDRVIEELKGVSTLIVSALRFTPSHLHFTVDEAVEFSEKVGAEKTWLTHIAHDLDHELTNSYLPPHIRMGYDGLQIPLWIESRK